MRAAGVTLLVALVSVAALPAQDPTKNELLVAFEKQLKAVSESAGPSVACVVVSKSDRYPKPASDQPGKLGTYDLKEFLKHNTAPGDARLGVALDLSDPKNIPDHGFACGVVIDPEGLILTPYHVVEGATKIYVHLPGKVGSYADIHAADGRHDLAVLKLINPPAQLKAIQFADVRLDARNGQKPTVGAGTLAVLLANVYVTGFAIDRPSATFGSVSNVRTRLATASNGQRKSDSYYFFGTFLEHDVRLNAGISGAALVNLDGKMIGLTTTNAAVSGDRGPNYAFPVDDSFQRVVDVLRRGEEVNYGYLGVTLNDNQNNVIIQSVIAQGPAATAGLDAGDVVTHINGVPVSTYDDLLVHIGSALADSKVKLTVSRSTRDLSVTLGKLNNEQPVIASVRPDPVFGLRVEYGSILAQKLPNGEVRGSNGVGPGVCVRELASDSKAAAAFKKLGDRPDRWLITHVNGAAVGTPAEFYKAAKGQPSVKLTVRDPLEQPVRDREVSFP